MPDQPSDSEGVAKLWYERSALIATGHYRTADHLAGRQRLLTGSSAVLSTLVGTTVFATLQSQPAAGIQILVGLVSVVAAGLTAFVGAMSYQEKAEKHRLAAAKYNAVGRRLEQARAGSQIDATELSAIRTSLDDLASEMPHIPRHIHNKMGTFADIDRWGDQPSRSKR